MAIDDLPLNLLDRDRSQDLIAYLSKLPIPKKDKRYIFLEWCKRFAYIYTPEDLKEVMT